MLLRGKLDKKGTNTSNNSLEIKSDTLDNLEPIINDELEALKKTLTPNQLKVCKQHFRASIDHLKSVTDLAYIDMDKLKIGIIKRIKTYQF